MSPKKNRYSCAPSATKSILAFHDRMKSSRGVHGGPRNVTEKNLGHASHPSVAGRYAPASQDDLHFQPLRARSLLSQKKLASRDEQNNLAYRNE